MDILVEIFCEEAAALFKAMSRYLTEDPEEVHEIPLSEQKNSLQEFELFISRM